MFYGKEVFDPWLIIYQIVFLQACFYLIQGLLILLFALSMGSGADLFSVSTCLSHSSMILSGEKGWIIVSIHVLTFVFHSFLLAKVVQRAKKCLDFSATVYILHFLACWIWEGWPSSVEWWIVNFIAFVGAALESEFICIRQEMKDIPMDQLELSNVRRR